jgi:hypothetical protein
MESNNGMMTKADSRIVAARKSSCGSGEQFESQM